ncbi:unnamed protein product [Closterium sp. NIES-65]|nr:unnamed protein product [Closterium sp. NIES-65]
MATFELTQKSPLDSPLSVNSHNTRTRLVGGQVDVHGMPGGADTPSWVRLAATAAEGGGGGVVVGGQVDLHGMPGGADTPSWVRLAATAAAGQRQLIVEGDVRGWRPGLSIAVASTSTNFNEAESREIGSVALVSPATSPPTSRITLTSPLAHTHEGTSVPDGFGGMVDIRAEVALLDRQIVIQGTDELPPHQYDGGHFMVYMTRTPQTIEGVQFRGLGNQGTLGRYPLHFHVCRLPADASQPHIVRKNAIVHSKQRCMVIHATSNMNIEDNITYETKGHCYLVEEGSEMGNVFRRNLGMSVRKVEKEIPPDTSDQYGFHTDKQPSVFWMATPYNSFYGNVAAGSENSGFWLEANPTMRGISRLLPAIGNKRPDRFNWGEYVGNVAHSSLFGFRTYPHGSQSRFPNYTGVITYLKDALLYRNKAGILFVNTDRIVVENGAFVENAYGMDISRNGGVTVKGCRFVGTLPSTCTAKAMAAIRSSSSSSSSTTTTTTTSSTSSSRSSSSGGSTTSMSLASSSIANKSNQPSATAPAPLSLSFHGPTTEWEPPGMADAIKPWAQFLYPFPSDDGGDSGEDGGGDYDDYGDYGGGAGGDTIAAAAAAPSGTGRQNRDTGRSLQAAQAAAAVVVPQKEIGDGSFESPIGVTLSQSNPADILRPSSVEHSFFSGYGTCTTGSFGTCTTGSFGIALCVFSFFPSPISAPSFRPMPPPPLSFSGYGTCTTGSFGIALVTNKPGGYWNTAFFVQPATTPPRGGLIARFYALRDLDGSLLGTPGAFAVAPFSPILPPATVRPSLCQYRAESAVWQCQSVCYRAVGVFYYEPGVRPNGMQGLPAKVLRPYRVYQLKCSGPTVGVLQGSGRVLFYYEQGVRPNGMTGLPSKVLRPYSYINITREEDGETFTAYGTDNDNPDSPPADPKRTAYRYVTASLLAGYTYRLTIIPAPTNSLFYPTWAQVRDCN